MALCVTCCTPLSRGQLLYLSGFESFWRSAAAPLGVVLRRDTSALTFLITDDHSETLVAMTAHYDDAVFFDYTDTRGRDGVGAFRSQRLTDGTVGNGSD